MVGDLPLVSLTSESLFCGSGCCGQCLCDKKKKQVRHAEQVFRGFDEGGQGHGWCRRVEGDMGHTQLKIGGQRRTCGPHRRERSVGRSKGKRGEEDKKQKKAGRKKK